MPIPLVQVDAFTNAAFGGNPAAVVFLDDGPAVEVDDDLLQRIAMEMNLSETAFPRRRPDGAWDLRWFTPSVEVDLCGHATLATAHALFERHVVDDDSITFHTRSGPLTCRRVDTAIVMDFPASIATPCDPIDGLTEAIGTPVLAQGRSFDIVAQVDSAATVAQLQPDLGAIAKIDTRAVIVTAPGDIDDGPADFVSRVFAPAAGIPEDPVTGSSHCILAPWWAERLASTTFAAHQVSPRGGRLGVHLVGDRVELTGNAVTVMTATLTV